MKKLIVLTALSILSAAAFAEGKTETGINYNDLGLGYVSQDITGNTSTNTFTGYGVNGSFLVSESIFGLASYSSTSHDFTGQKITVGQTKVGIGYRLPLAETTDLNVLGSYSTTTATTFSDTTGYGLSIGIRSVALSPDLETGLFYTYVSSKQGSTTTNKSGYSANLKYKISGNFYIGGEYVSVKDLTQYSIGVGYKF